MLTRIPWRTVIAASFFFGAARHPPRGDPGAAGPRSREGGAGAWLGVAYIIIFPTVFAYAASTWAVRRSSPALVPPTALCSPW